MKHQSNSIPTAGAFIRQKRDDKGLSLEEIAGKLRKKRDWLSKIERGKIRMYLDTFIDLCATLEVDLPNGFLIYRNYNQEGGRSQVITLSEMEKLKGLLDENEYTITPFLPKFTAVIAKGAEYTSVPFYGVRPFLNDAPPFDFEASDECEIFRSEWLRDTVADASGLACLTVSGDSMAPTLRHGDSILVDRSASRVTQDAIYLVRPVHPGAAIIKRCWRDLKSGGIIVSSDNPTYPPQSLGDDDVRVLGRVVWYARIL